MVIVPVPTVEILSRMLVNPATLTLIVPSVETVGTIPAAVIAFLECQEAPPSGEDSIVIIAPEEAKPALVNRIVARPFVNATLKALLIVAALSVCPKAAVSGCDIGRRLDILIAEPPRVRYVGHALATAIS